MSLPTGATERKQIPVFSGLFKYFPHALAAVAQLSWVGDRQHNPGKPEGAPPHWAKEKSTDETDAMMRHMLDMAENEMHRDPDGVLAAVKAAWRALANLERMWDRGLWIFWEPALVQPSTVNKHTRYGDMLDLGGPRVPDAFCVSTPDGGCISEDPRCMHQPGDVDLADDGTYIVQVIETPNSLDSPLRAVSYFGPFKTLDGAEREALKYTKLGEVSVHALNYA